jgi:glycosyltransferase involved in cell wall biosynthesis
MNKPILTIAIPTYNRAHHLDRQLDWAVRSIANRWDQLELIVSDNGSHDATPQVCARWQQQSGGQLHVFRHPRNLGLPLNALHCIQQANGQYLWLVSDDDEILDGVLDWVLHVLSSDHSKELSFILLNAMMKDKQGKVILEGVYSFINDRFENPGSSLFQECLRHSIAPIGLTGSIYRSQIVKAALERWPSVKDNAAFPLFLAGYAASRGGMLVRAEPSLAFIDGTTSFKSIWPVVDFYLIPEVYIKLLDEGYQEEFIRARILSNLNLVRFILKFPIQFLKSIKIYLKAFRLKKYS